MKNDYVISLTQVGKKYLKDIKLNQNWFTWKEKHFEFWAWWILLYKCILKPRSIIHEKEITSKFAPQGGVLTLFINLLFPLPQSQSSHISTGLWCYWCMLVLKLKCHKPLKILLDSHQTQSSSLRSRTLEVETEFLFALCIFKTI